jgi:VIT1/CCC1 family predicted Fe2+/Mn2+ transporter
VTDDLFESSKRPLEPIERISEVLFGLIMVLTFTGSLSVAEAGRTEIRTMLLGALGCNLAWGLIDGVFYLMGCVEDMARKIMIWDTVRKGTDPQEAYRAIAGTLPPALASTLQPAELEAMRLKLKSLPEPSSRPLLRKHDWLGAAAVFLLVFLSTFPAVIPFMVMKDIKLAMRFSNGIAIVLLFLTGMAFGRRIGRHPVRIGIAAVILGAALVSLTIALGG